MPYKSDAQRRYMHARHPEIAARWDAEIRAKKKTKVAKALQVRVVGHGFIDPLLPRAKAAQFRTSAGKTRKVRAREQKVISNAVRAENNDWWVRGPIPPLVQRYERVYKRMSPEQRLRHQKRLQAISSMTGGTIGLAGLGMLAAGKKYPKALTHLPKVTAVGAGVGGVGAFNFASIQNQESKLKPQRPKQNVYVVRNKRQIKNIKSGLEPVGKGFDTMDFGLNDVHQGENIEVSKAYRKYLSSKDENKVGQAAYLGAVGTPVAGYFGGHAARAGKSGYKLQRSLGSSRVASHAAGARTVGAGVKYAAAPEQVADAIFRPKGLGKLYAGALVGGLGAAYGTSKYIRSKPPYAPKNKKKEIEKRFGFSKPYMTRNPGLNGNTVRQWHGPKTPFTNRALDAKTYTPEGQVVAQYRHRTTLNQTGKRTLAGAGATGVVGTGGLAFKKREKKVEKSYNPEDKRLRRNANTATALSVGSGATAAGAYVYGKKAWGTPHRTITVHPASPQVKTTKSGAKKMEPPKPKTKVIHRGTGLRSPAKPEFVRGLKNAGKAGALGVTAVGLALASDRVRTYSAKKGASYRPLHRITSS